MNISVVVPTCDPGEMWQNWCVQMKEQESVDFEIIHIDSASFVNVDSQDFFDSNYKFKCIDRANFNHGGSRNLGASFANKNCDILIFMTQDALLNDSFSIKKLSLYFSDPNVAAVCGRQIPHNDANAIARHARLFNYPTHSSIKTIDDISNLGIKTAFMSNSFAAYRKSVFDELGGFPSNTILGEDMYLTSKIILAGYKVVYAADAIVKHSHNYTVLEEFRRYFDIGVFHAMEPWIIEKFGKAEGEGKKFVLSEISYLIKNQPLFIPKAVLQTFAKYFGYKLGTNYKSLPIKWCKRFSMTKSFWK